MTKVVYVKTSDTCNLHCDHCFTSGRNGGKVKWDAEVTTRWLSGFSERYPTESIDVIFHGGEPMLAPIEDMHWFMDQFEGSGHHHFLINTNLVYSLTEERLSLLRRTGHIGTSWDLGIRFANEAQLALWESNLKQLKGEGLTFGIMVSVTRSLTELDVDAFLDVMAELAPDSVKLERLTLNGNAQGNPQVFPDNEAQDNWFVTLYKQYKQRQAELPFVIQTLDTIEEKLSTRTVKVDTNCRNCEQHFVTINADGSLSGCPNSAAEQQYASANSPVEMFLNSEGRVNEIAKELSFHPTCLTCDVFQHCGGDCHRLPWQGQRCGGLKNLIRYILHEGKQHIPILTIE